MPDSAQQQTTNHVLATQAKDAPTDPCDPLEEIWLEDEDWGTWPLAVLLNMAASVLIGKRIK